MTFKTHITSKEYLKLLLGLTYRKPIMILILFVGFAMLVWICGYYLNLLPLPKPTIYQFITLFLISIVQPIVIINTILRNYKSSNYLSELLEIELTNNEIKIQGQSFFTEIKWKNVFKIEEHKNWFLIYQNTLSAIVIPKNDFHGGEQDEFVKILKGVTDVPIHLRSNS